MHSQPPVPKVFISYSHDSREHLDRILALSQRLRQGGIDCQIDQYQDSPPRGWPNWCTEQIEESQFVLVACTETYLLRFRGKEVPGRGFGGTWEGHIVIQELYNAQGRNSKFIPVVFSEDDLRHRPPPLQSATSYDLSLGYDTLYNRLIGRRRVIEAPLGEILPVLERKQTFLPPWNIPHARNPFFTGREKVLERLQTVLETRRAAALSGLGGVGKTQTAIEYAWLHRDAYQAVLWTKAEIREDLVSGFVAIAKLLNLPQAASTDQQAAAAAARQWFEQNCGWLLILDNADDIPWFATSFQAQQTAKSC